MEPYEYFLPKSHSVGTRKEGLPCQIYQPIFTHSFHEDDVKDFSQCIHRDRLCLNENGKGVVFGINKHNNDISYKSYHVCGDELVLTRKTRLKSEKDYQHRLYDYDKEICFLFRSVRERGTRIYISFIVFNGSSEELVEDALVLEYEHVFNQYRCYLSAELKRIVIITGHHKYGHKKLHNDLRDTYLNVISYTLHDETVEVAFCEEAKRNVTEICRNHMGNHIDRLYFTIDRDKIILVSSKEHFVLVYSVPSDRFGSVYQWKDGPKWAAYSYFYAYNKHLGDLFFICGSDGKIRSLKESNLSMQLLDESSFSLSALGFPFETFSFFNMDYYEDVLLFAFVKSSSILLIVDCLQKKVIGTYVPDAGCSIRDVNTNWSGEEVFLFLTTPHSGFVFEVFRIHKKFSLQGCSKRTVLQAYSIKELRDLDLPKQLKEEFYRKIYQ